MLSPIGHLSLIAFAWYRWRRPDARHTQSLALLISYQVVMPLPNVGQYETVSVIHFHMRIANRDALDSESILFDWNKSLSAWMTADGYVFLSFHMLAMAIIRLLPEGAAICAAPLYIGDFFSYHLPIPYESRVDIRSHFPLSFQYRYHRIRLLHVSRYITVREVGMPSLEAAIAIAASDHDCHYIVSCLMAWFH